VSRSCVPVLRRAEAGNWPGPCARVAGASASGGEALFLPAPLPAYRQGRLQPPGM